MGRIELFCVLCVMMLGLSSLPASINVRAHTDQDSSGLHRNYNTDNTVEWWVRTDYSDDTVQKVFYIGQNEYDNSDRAYLWIYAKSWGTKQETSNPTHEIKIIGPSGSTTARYFTSYELFTYDAFHWQMFEFNKAVFEAGHWAKVRIKDLDAYDVNNLEFGIDRTYGANPVDPTHPLIPDLDQSYVYSAGAGSTPTQENEFQGELMIKLEFVFRQKEIRSIPINFDENYNLPYSYIPLDDSNDKIRWRTLENEITQNDIAASSYARLYIYGYSWIGGSDPNPPPTQNHFTVKINNNIYFWDPDLYYVQTGTIGQWYYFDFVPQGNLIGGQQNIFEIKDLSSDYVRHNLGIIKFIDIDDQRSAWYYNPGGGQWIGDPNLIYTNCQGELGIYLFLFKKFEPSKIVGGVCLYCENHATQHCPYQNNHGILEHPAGSWIADRLENSYGWMDKLQRLDDDSESPYTEEEGRFSSEFWRNSYAGDACDLVIFDGHGNGRGGMYLPQSDLGVHLSGQTYGMWSDEDIFTNIAGYLYGVNSYGTPETDAFNYMNDNQYSDYSEDGFNFNADWILILACGVLHGLAGGDAHALDKDNPMQIMLYHGAHALMGFATDFFGTPAEIGDFADSLLDSWCDNQIKIIDGFVTAVKTLDRNNNNNRYMIYYHNNNRNDYLWDEDTVTPDFDFAYGYEDRDIKCIPDDAGVTI